MSRLPPLAPLDPGAAANRQAGSRAGARFLPRAGVCLLAWALAGCATPPGGSELAAAVDARVAAIAADAAAARSVERAPSSLRQPAMGAASTPRSAQARLAEADRPREALLDTSISLSLSGASLRETFDAIAQRSGLQFVFDPDLDTSSRLDLEAGERRVGEVLQLLARTRGFEYRFLFRDWVLVYPAIDSKRSQHAVVTARSVRLQQADLQQVPALLSQLAGLSDIFVDEASRIVFMRGTSEALLLAEHLLAGVDLPLPEVLVELEIFEVARQGLRDLGLELPQAVIVGAIDSRDGALRTGVVALEGGGLRAAVANPALVAHLRSEDGTVSRIANPRMRVSHGEKGSLKVGSRLPVFTTTASAEIGLTTAVSYLETGVRLEVEPRVLGDGEVDLRLDVEFSDVVGERRSAGGERGYQVDTQRASTALRLRDGESWVLAGADRKAVMRGDRSFGAARRGERADVTRLILVTPRILRAPADGRALAQGVAAGTAARPGQAQLSLAPGPVALRHEGGPRADRFEERAVIDMQTIAMPVARLSLPETARPEALVVARVELEGLGEASAGRVDLVYDIGALESLDGTTKPGSISRPFSVSEGRAQVDVSFRVKPDGDGAPAIVAAGLRLVVRGEEYEFPLSASGAVRIRD